MTDETEPQCDECGSNFIAARSAMAGLCAECAHQLYSIQLVRMTWRTVAVPSVVGTDQCRSFFAPSLRLLCDA
jgi:hypothetical protein